MSKKKKNYPNTLCTRWTMQFSIFSYSLSYRKYVFYVGWTNGLIWSYMILVIGP